MTLMAGNIPTSSLTHTGTVRARNEDAVLAMPSSGLWAVADGMGGHDAGDYASECIMRHLEQLAQTTYGSDLVHQVSHALNAANLEIYNYSQANGERRVVGSTIVVLVMEGDKYHCFWCGDSRCYLKRDQQLLMITQDHTEAQEMVDNGLLSPDLVDTVPESNVLTNAVGIGPELSIDYIHDHIYEQDAFYLCSDGVNKVFSDDEIMVALDDSDIERANQSLLANALEQGSPDNFSSIIVCL